VQPPALLKIFSDKKSGLLTVITEYSWVKSPWLLRELSLSVLGQKYTLNQFSGIGLLQPKSSSEQQINFSFKNVLRLGSITA
jgi:hypothetical protein